MTLRDLENVIDDESDVSVDILDSNDFPYFYKWAELKRVLKPDG